MITNTSLYAVVAFGKLKVAACSPPLAVNGVAPAFIENLTAWPVTNGWFGRYIVLVGIGTCVLVSPMK